MLRRSGAGGSANGGERDALAPVIPLFSTGDAVDSEGSGTVRDAEASAADEQTTADAGRDAAERALVRKLGARSLSVREARTVLAGRGLSSDAVDEIVAGFARRGYLDDSALAEQLVHSGTERKGQGRQALAQAMAKRGVPRDVADAAIRELPDDDAERALEFARKALQEAASDH
jgi:regulatory protein